MLQAGWLETAGNKACFACCQFPMRLTLLCASGAQSICGPGTPCTAACFCPATTHKCDAGVCKVGWCGYIMRLAELCLCRLACSS